MPVPLPSDHDVNLRPSDSPEVDLIARGIISAITPPGGLTDLQQMLFDAAFEAMTGVTARVADLVPISPHACAQGLARRNEAFCSRMVQSMIMGALVLRPLPPEVAARVGEFAREMSIDDGMLTMAQRFAAGSLGLARSTSSATATPPTGRPSGRRRSTRRVCSTARGRSASPTPRSRSAGRASPTPPAGTLGRGIFEFYEARGFVFPGQPGSAPPLLAQYDWVHVLADYGSRVESELEVFAFISRANDDPRAFSLFAMVLSLFETGYLRAGAGLFEAYRQLSQDGVAQRVADALRRGALSHGLDGAADVDFLAVDWFTLADRPVAELRDAFGIVPKSDKALAAGSVGPWEPGGISEYQYETAQERAAAEGRVYEAHGATPFADHAADDTAQ